MGFIVDLSVTKLRAGDQITFTLTGGPNAGTYTLTVIPSINQPVTLEVRATDDVVPTSNEWQIAVSRLTAAIGQVGGTVSVIPTDTIVTVSFEQDVTNVTVNIIDASGSLINHVRTTESDGTIIDFDPPLVPNIRVSSTTHRLLEYVNYTSLNYPHGNMGDKLETVINFTSADTFSVLDFLSGS